MARDIVDWKVLREARMGEIVEKARDELRQLPFMLGKVLGGLMAVGGSTVMVVILTRKPGHTVADILPSALLGGTGIVVFVLSAWLLDKRLAEHGSEGATASSLRTSLLSWAILLLFGAIFLVCSYFLTR